MNASRSQVRSLPPPPCFAPPFFVLLLLPLPPCFAPAAASRQAAPAATNGGRSAVVLKPSYGDCASLTAAVVLRCWGEAVAAALPPLAAPAVALPPAAAPAVVLTGEAAACWVALPPPPAAFREAAVESHLSGLNLRAGRQERRGRGGACDEWAETRPAYAGSGTDLRDLRLALTQ